MNRVQLPLAALFGALMPLVFDSALKGAALLAAAALGALVLYKASAATRHLVWLVAVVALLIVPVLSVVLPGWRVLPNWAVVAVEENGRNEKYGNNGRHVLEAARCAKCPAAPGTTAYAGSSILFFAFFPHLPSTGHLPSRGSHSTASPRHTSLRGRLASSRMGRRICLPRAAAVRGAPDASPCGAELHGADRTS